MERRRSKMIIVAVLTFVASFGAELRDSCIVERRYSIGITPLGDAFHRCVGKQSPKYDHASGLCFELKQLNGFSLMITELL